MRTQFCDEKNKRWKKIWIKIIMKVTLIPIEIVTMIAIVVCSLKSWKRDLEKWRLEEEWRPSRPQHSGGWLEYFGESWRAEETCCHSDLKEKLVWWENKIDNMLVSRMKRIIQKKKKKEELNE